jgi:hypothetical protein
VNGRAGVQCRGACRDRGVGGGGKVAHECWGSPKRIRQCCLVLAVLTRYSRGRPRGIDKTGAVCASAEKIAKTRALH